jgi:hypothetical protein
MNPAIVTRVFNPCEHAWNDVACSFRGFRRHAHGLKTRVTSVVFALFALALLGVFGAAAPVPTTDASFTYVDVAIDPHGSPLAAYQFELRATAGDVKLVGIEGGEHAAFAKPPYYDTRALLNDRIVIAAFNTGTDLPSAKTRVARLMVRVTGPVPPKYDVKLQVAASSDAKPIDANISISEGAAR